VQILQQAIWFETKTFHSWSTPDEYLSAVRECLGEIELDPATHEVFQKRIRAKNYYTRETNGLENPWFGKVWLCTPYGQPELTQFIQKAKKEWDSGNIKEMLIMTHSSETWEDWFHLAESICSAILFVKGCVKWVPAWGDRIDSLKLIGIDETCFPKYSVHGSVIFYSGDNPEKFKGIFSRFGFVR
jgi:hypothetical protein